MRRAVVVILDGLRRDLIRPDLTPNLVALSKRATQFTGYRSAFPSATRVVSATFATGCRPARHELQGNALALIEDGKLVVHDAGHPEFLQHKREVTGCSLAVPTMAERLSEAGGFISFSNVSPGAAFAHDPDGFGWVYHRAGSYGPGRERLPEADWLKGETSVAGDAAMADRFIAEVLQERRPALAQIWFGEPDQTQHNAPLGSPRHLDVLRGSDQTAGRLIEAVEALRAVGDDILLIVGADHGHQTISGMIDVEAELVAAGIKEGAGSGDIVAVSSGTSSLIYVHPDRIDLIPALGEFLASAPWAGEVISADDFERVGQAAHQGLAYAVSMQADEEPNEYGVPGRSLIAKPASGKAKDIGCGQHGGLARYEQAPFLMISGEGFGEGQEVGDEVSVIDIAPTILAHLGVEAEGMDGQVLQGMAAA
ncbi:MAG: alkaline phosphatase family protein [Hyphomicrobiaceae bacterium]